MSQKNKNKIILSDIRVIHTCVPQGTCLEPILFLIMINDLFYQIPVPYFQYVDYTFRMYHAAKQQALRSYSHILILMDVGRK